MTPELAEFCGGGHRLICGSDDDAGGGPVCQGRDGSGADAMRVTFCKKEIWLVHVLSLM